MVYQQWGLFHESSNYLILIMYWSRAAEWLFIMESCFTLEPWFGLGFHSTLLVVSTHFPIVIHSYCFYDELRIVYHNSQSKKRLMHLIHLPLLEVTASTRTVIGTILWVSLLSFICFFKFKWWNEDHFQSNGLDGRAWPLHTYKLEGPSRSNDAVVKRKWLAWLESYHWKSNELHSIVA